MQGINIKPLGVMSQNQVKKCRKAVENVINSVLFNYDKSLSWKEQRFITFVTLTLPVPQLHSDRVFRKMQTRFLENMTKTYNVDFYVWKAETQANGNIQTLSNIIRIRILTIVFAVIASFQTLLPLDLPDLILGLCLTSSFIPLIIIITSVSMVGINSENNIQKSLLQAVTIYITTPILFYGLYLVAIPLYPFLGQWTVLFLRITFDIVFCTYLMMFSSFRNLHRDTKEMDKYLK